MGLFDRTAALIGEDKINKLANSAVLVVGLGGVGAACVEALARSAVGKIFLLDFDTISDTNINRQLIATTDNIGKHKAHSAANRVLSINPGCSVTPLQIFLNDETLDEVLSLPIDYIVDCIDTVSSKLSLIEGATKKGIPIISSMGTGNRLDPTKLVIGDIGDTSGHGCPLARIMRRELRKREVTSLSVVFSTEVPAKIVVDSDNGRNPPASSAFVPNAAGFTLAYKVVSDIIKE